MSEAESIEITDIDPRELGNLETPNPNVMDPHDYQALVAGITKYGFLQPILVLWKEDSSKYVVIDGVHRSKAAIEAGLSNIPAVVAKDEAHAEILRIALNKIRGQLDITEVGRQLESLLEDGFSKEDLELTGFQDYEIDAMLDAMSDTDDDLLDDVDTSSAQPKPKTYNLVLKFPSEVDKASVKEAFEKMGKGDLELGALHLAVSCNTNKEARL